MYIAYILDSLVNSWVFLGIPRNLATSAYAVELPKFTSTKEKSKN